MDPPVSNMQPSTTGRVMLPSIKNLVDALPPPNAYRSSSTWNQSFHSLGPEASSAQINGAHRNRTQALPPAMQTPPPRHYHSQSPQTVTPSSSNIFSSASSGVSEGSNQGDYVRPPAPTNLSVPGAPIQSTPRDQRSDSPNSSVLTPFPGTYRPIRPSHSLVSQLPTMHQPQQPRHPRGGNLESRLPVHSSGDTTTSTSTATPIARMNAAPVPNRDPGGTHHQIYRDPRTVPHASDRQSGTYSPPPSGRHHHHHFLTPSSEHRLPPRNNIEYMHRQERTTDDRDDPREGRLRSTSHTGQYPPPTPPWERQNLQETHRSPSIRELDPGDARSRSTQQPSYSRPFNDSPAPAEHSGSYHSQRTLYSGSYVPREPEMREDRMDGRAGNEHGYGLRPARWVESGFIYGHKEMDSRGHDPPSHADNAVMSRHGVIRHAMPVDDGDLLITRDGKYPPIQPAPSQQQRPYVAVDESRARHTGITVRPSRYGAEAALGMSRDSSMRTLASKQSASTASSSPFTRVPSRPPLPEGLIRHKSKEDLQRVLHELTQEANHAVAEGKAMKKINEFSKTIQQFARYQARYPGPPTATSEDVEEISHRAVLIYRMAHAVKSKIVAKKATATQSSQAAGGPSPIGPQSPDVIRGIDKKKKKPMTKEERQVMEDMERIRRKRTSAQQGIKSKYMKRNKKTLAPKQCASCNTKETPEWRKGPDGPRSLCNACGLHWAKLQRKRKEDGQWVGQGAPPPIDIITLRQVTGVGLQPRFNERGELEIPGTYINIPPNRPAFGDIRRWKPPTPPGVTSASANEGSSNAAGPSGNTVSSSGTANPPVQDSEGNNIPLERLSMEDDRLPQLQQQEPPPPLGFVEAPGAGSKKRKASRDHGDPEDDDAGTTAPSTKKRRVASPVEDTRLSTPAEETVWARAF